MPSVNDNYLLLAEELRKKKASGEIKADTRLKLGDLLTLTGLVSKEFVADALHAQNVDHKKIGEILISKGFISKDMVLAALSVKFGFEFIDLSQHTIPPGIISLIPASLAKKLQVVPIEINGDSLIVAISDPTDHSSIEDTLQFFLNKRIQIVIASEIQILEAISSYYRRMSPQAKEKAKITKNKKEKISQKKGAFIVDDIIDQMVDDDSISIEVEEEDASISESDSLVIKLVNNILISAASKMVSDIHFESKGANGQTLVRFRIDGVCQDAHVIAPIYERAVISRLKILSNLNITERRHPQSGRIAINYQDEIIEYRIEVIPTSLQHEDAVLRISSSSSRLSLTDLKLTDSNLKQFTETVNKPYGLILCVGPTGSGKTTTLHAALDHINIPEKKIWTAEDPIEITQDRLRQVQINKEFGFTFKDALRSFLRADPDVIMVGEMRDLDTANISIEASLTGHLVFSTLHTNSAAETISRLIQMGVEPFNFADAMLSILAQRLCRKTCPHCKTEHPPTDEELSFIVNSYGEEYYKKDELPESANDIKLARAHKCSSCNNIGYSGRLAIHELLINDNIMKTSIQNSEKALTLHQLALDQGMRSLMMDGIKKVLNQETTIIELRRVSR